MTCTERLQNIVEMTGLNVLVRSMVATPCEGIVASDTSFTIYEPRDLVGLNVIYIQPGQESHPLYGLALSRKNSRTGS